jgi:hypothetical protein
MFGERWWRSGSGRNNARLAGGRDTTARTAVARAFTSDGRRLVRRAGLALPAAVWVLGLVSPAREGLTPGYVASYSLLLVDSARRERRRRPPSSR